MYAVIRAGGKQYRVASGDVIEVDRLSAREGETVTFDPVLVVDGSTVKASASDVGSVRVTGEVLGAARGPKIRVFNYHAKTGWKKNKGHRSQLTKVRITEIG